MMVISARGIASRVLPPRQPLGARSFTGSSSDLGQEARNVATSASNKSTVEEQSIRVE